MRQIFHCASRDLNLFHLLPPPPTDLTPQHSTHTIMNMQNISGVIGGGGGGVKVYVTTGGGT